MKKLLLSTAVCGLAFAAAPAFAEPGGVDLTVGGYYKGYLSFVDQDERRDDNAGASTTDESRSIHEFDWLQDTEIHFGGEYTLDNGLTVGAWVEGEADGGDNFNIPESYAYFSGAWGRINAGAEDGAVYLLQVVAPSADDDFDSLRQDVSGVNYNVAQDDDTDGSNAVNGILGEIADDDWSDAANELLYSSTSFGDDIRVNTTFNLSTRSDILTFDYDNDISGSSSKLTYLSPVLNGFQIGASWTPDVSYASSVGNRRDDGTDGYGDTWEIAGRYEGTFNAVTVALGAGYAFSNLENDGEYNDNDADVLVYEDENNDGNYDEGVDGVVGRLDDRQAWNAAGALTYGPVGGGVAYVHDDIGVDGEADRDTWVFGLDYTTGPFKLGASWLTQTQEIFIGDMDTNRYTGGVIYTYGPGMTFRGSVSYIDHDLPASDDLATTGEEDFDATTVMVGTQINF